MSIVSKKIAPDLSQRRKVRGKTKVQKGLKDKRLPAGKETARRIGIKIVEITPADEGELIVICNEVERIGRNAPLDGGAVHVRGVGTPR